MKPDPTIEKRLAEVRELVKQSRISEARRILVELDHPTAHLWLQRLREVDQNSRKKKDHQVNWGFVRLIILVFIVSILASVLVVLLFGTTGSDPYFELTATSVFFANQTALANLTETVQARNNVDANSLAIRQNILLTVTAEASGQ